MLLRILSETREYMESPILPPQLYRCNILDTSKLHRLLIYAFDNNATKMALSNPIISIFFMCNIHKRC